MYIMNYYNKLQMLQMLLQSMIDNEIMIEFLLQRMETHKISSFIIAKNEESRIARAINSLKQISEEIIVVDSGSTDKTVEIAESLGARVVYNEWPGYVKQKAFAEKLCKNDWVLNIDAD